jgi:hypothetical protein
MSFILNKTTSLTFLLSGLTNYEKEICERMKQEVDEYLLNDKPEDLLKLLVSSFSDTLRLGLEESVPLLKNFLSFIRHRLMEGNPQEFKRLMALLDSYIRSCGIRAQVLIGRKKFLDTVVDTAKRYSKVPMSSSQECASYAVNLLEEWNLSFDEYRQHFPYYYAAVVRAKSIVIVLHPNKESPLETKPKIKIDYTSVMNGALQQV